MTHDIKVKHIDEIFGGGEVTPFEILGIKDTWYNRIRYRDDLYIFNYNLKQFLDSKSEDIKFEPCEIKIPSSLDNIPFQQMISLQNFNTKEKSFAEVVSKRIAIVCKDANNCSEKSLEHRAKELSFLHAMGIINWINASQKSSQMFWEKRFMQVSVIDKDYDQAGGHILNQFNVINTIKNTCVDFNISYEEAWQMSYSVIQTNSLSKASAAYVQNRMQDIKEARFKARQKSRR